MKSRTSCFNWTVFRKNITRYWPLWSLYLAFLMLEVPFYIWQMAAGSWFGSLTGEVRAYRAYHIMERAVEYQLDPYSVFFFSVVMVMAVFSYLYSPRNTNMIHALPVTRLELYMTNYLSGLSFLVLPELVTFLVSVLVCLGYGITCIQYLFCGVLCRLGMEIFAYTLAVFVAMFTGQILAVPVYDLIVNYLYVGGVYILNALVGLVTFGYGGYDIWEQLGSGPMRILSPLFCLSDGLSVDIIYENISIEAHSAAYEQVARGLKIYGMELVGIYVVAAAVLAVAAYQLYRCRQLEAAGDWISIRAVKPVFRWGVALCGGTLVSVVLAEVLWDVRKANVYGCIVISMLAGGFLFFFLAEMVLHKSFRVFGRRRLAECAGCLAVGVLVLTLFELDAFGIERRVPGEDEILAAFVYMDYPMQVEAEDIPVLLDMQREVIASEDAYMDVVRENGSYYYTTFRYYLKDGTTFERRYPIPVTDEYAKDGTTPAGRILGWEREPENLTREILGMNYRENHYVSGRISLYDAAGNYFDYIFRDRELTGIVDAVLADIGEGNFAPYYQYSIADGEMESYGSDIWLEYYNSHRMSNYNYYWDYVQEDTGSGTMTGQELSYGMMGTYLRWGPRCVHVAAALKELGITGEDALLVRPEQAGD